MADEVGVERVDDKLLKLDLKFREPHVEFEELTLAGSGDGNIRVDDFNLARDFGITVTAVKGDLKVPKRIEVSTTAPYLNTAFRENPALSLECVMRAGNLKEVGARMRQFHALWRLPGVRVLRLANGRERGVFVKDGFSVSIVSDGVVKFTLNVIEYDRNLSEDQ